MKIPFYTVLGPVLKTSQSTIRAVCDNPLLRYSKGYVAFLGILGMLLSVYDILRIIRCGSKLPNYLLRQRAYNLDDKAVSPEAERDLKLICLVLSTEYYLFLWVGILTNNPVFFLPFLVLYAVMVVLELMAFFVKLIAGQYEYSRNGLLGYLFMFVNWVCVFCTFARLTTGCDF